MNFCLIYIGFFQYQIKYQIGNIWPSDVGSQRQTLTDLTSDSITIFSVDQTLAHKMINGEIRTMSLPAKQNYQKKPHIFTRVLLHTISKNT